MGEHMFRIPNSELLVETSDDLEDHTLLIVNLIPQWCEHIIDVLSLWNLLKNV